jgi:Uma2 family endonuclease
MATKPLKKHATYDDLRDVPNHFVAEMFDGDLYATPRPALPHTLASSALAAKIFGSFHRNGKCGWIILNEPELHFSNDVLVPDIAGWRRTRLPAVPPDPYMTVAPDWVCEVLSASTERIDRGQKLRIYAREGVAHAWLIDPLRRTLEVLTLESRPLPRWTAQSTHEGRVSVRAVPFDSVEIDLGTLWI